MRGDCVMLGDTDRQLSARDWLGIRPTSFAPIRSWDTEKDSPARPPKGKTHVVLDTPAIAAFPAADLRNPVMSLRTQAEPIVSALDTLFGAY